jgi:hypothetical protein
MLRRIFILFLLTFASSVFGELQNSLSITAPTLYPGDSGSFSASSLSGPAASAIGTKSFTYSGHIK